MKHLKRFDEELNPNTYRRAGQRLIGKFKEERGRNLIDYGNEKEFGFYNMYFANVSGKINNTMENGKYVSKMLKFTNPSADFYFESFSSNSFDNNGKLEIRNKSAEDMVKSWKEGGELAFTISFRFNASEETKKLLKHDALKSYLGTPMFSFKVQLSDFVDGIDEFNTTETGEVITGPDAHDTYDMFVNSFYPNITLEKPVDKYYFGIFRDRASAFKFKKALPDLIDPFHDQIHDIISVIGGESEQFEKIIGLFEKITINGLYDDDDNARARFEDFSNRWFSGNELAN